MCGNLFFLMLRLNCLDNIVKEYMKYLKVFLKYIFLNFICKEEVEFMIRVEICRCYDIVKFL